MENIKKPRKPGTPGKPDTGISLTESVIDDKQTIIFGFIMVTAFIVLGIANITNYLKKKRKKKNFK